MKQRRSKTRKAGDIGTQPEQVRGTLVILQREADATNGQCRVPPREKIETSLHVRATDETARVAAHHVDRRVAGVEELSEVGAVDASLHRDDVMGELGDLGPHGGVSLGDRFGRRAGHATAK